MLKIFLKKCMNVLVPALLLPIAAIAQSSTSIDSIGSESSLIGSYRLGPGDVIDIQVFGESDLSGKIKLNEDGVINYAFVGEFSVTSRSLEEVENLLDNALRGDYLVDPRVTVSVAEYRPFYISGAVNRPGSYAYQLGLTVSKAISIAGGLSERASERKIYLVEDGGLEADRRRVQLDDPLQPGDSLNIEESFF
jgi:polysaccharide export outer membrane protein